MEYTEIVELIAEMLREDSRQPPLTAEELPELLYECLAMHHMVILAKRNSAIGTDHLAIHQQARQETYAASLPADDSVNSPVPPPPLTWWQEEVLAAMRDTALVELPPPGGRWFGVDPAEPGADHTVHTAIHRPS